MERRSGVVITLVRKQLTTVVENTEADFDNILLLKLSGSVFNVDRDVFLIYCCVCPQHSLYNRDRLQVRFTVGGGMHHVRKREM